MFRKNMFEDNIPNLPMSKFINYSLKRASKSLSVTEPYYFHHKQFLKEPRYSFGFLMHYVRVNVVREERSTRAPYSLTCLCGL